jgi:transcriptional regulator GlxA family with amidase domain
MLPHTLALDWAGPAEAFRLANQSLLRAGQAPRFVMRFAGVQNQLVSSVGLHWAQIEPLPAELPQMTWLVLMGRPDEAAQQGLAQRRELLRWLRSLSTQADDAGALPAPHKLITICSGAVLAAQAGLLAHTRATTHHLELQDLQQAEPSCEVLANRVFVQDERRRV